jgi:DNA-directed DNA polymerase III PolC
MYINCKTYYSFRYGTFATEELVNTAVNLGITSLAVTNINSTCDLWQFVKLCKEAGIKPIVGVEVRNEIKLLYILLAANNNGLAWINEFLSEHLIQKKDFPEKPTEPFFLDLWDGFVIYPLNAKEPERLLPNERIGVLPWEINKLFTINWEHYKDKFVIRQPVTFQNKKYYNLHRLLRAIDLNVLGTKLPLEAQADVRETFIPPNKLIPSFKQYPFIITNTYRVMDDCSISIDFTEDKNKQCFTASKKDDKILLEKLAVDGFEKKYEKKNKVAWDRLQKELSIIDNMSCNAFFLINFNIVKYADTRRFYHVGRGSGGNSIVAYCLEITNVDPIELNLFFERFLNPERISAPDFDLDFSYRDRDEMFDYIFKTYGKDHVALCGSFTTFKHDSAIRELGKVFGLPDEEIKILQRTNHPTDNIQRQILHYGNLMLGFPNILSIHACGILITEKKVTNYVTMFMPPKGFAGSQIDMYIAEDISIHKFDILSQRGLGHIKDCLQLVKENKGVDINIHDFKKFRNDELIKKQIREANTIGCFYIESPAMRQLLKKLRCDDYNTLVVASSIIRPGVAQSGMMREFIFRYHNPEKVKYLHPLFEEHLKETFGVMVFQEDVIKIAYYFGELSFGEADVLRRAMSNKYKNNNKFFLMKEKFLSNCKRIGHSDNLSNEVWRQMESFAGYSFCKAHSASFAVESYMSLYLKTYYPKEFMVAVIINEGGFYSTELYFLELLKAGGNIHNPCINQSEQMTCIRNNEVYVGFNRIKGLHSKLVETILNERNSNGNFLNLQDFIERTNIGIKQLELLISIGAFRFTGRSKKQLLWEANFLQKKNQPALHSSHALFIDEPIEFTLPELKDEPLDDLYDEMEILGFPLANPFELAAEDSGNYFTSKDLNNNIGKSITVICYYVAHKQVPTKDQEEMYFGTFVDCNLDWIDTVHFPDSAERYPLNKSGFYKITGKVVEDFGVCSIEVHKMIQVGYKQRKYANL